MSLKRKCQETNIDQEIIFNELSDVFEDTYKELLNILKQKTNYKHLERFGEGQFFNPAAECDNTMKVKVMNLNIINLHAVKVYETIDEIISKKFNKSFHNLLKQKILKIILKLHNKHDSSEVEDELLQDNFEDSSKNEEKAVLETLKGLSQYCAESLNDITKQVIEMPIVEVEPSSSQNVKEELQVRIKEEISDTDESLIDVETVSFGSVSSVHTSELSSFDGDIVFSSDEESETKEKRMSLKAVEDRIAEFRSKKLDDLNKQNQDKSTGSEDASKSKSPSKESLNVPEAIVPQRVCKSNHAENYVKKTCLEKVVPSGESSTVNVPSIPKRVGPKKKVLTFEEALSTNDPPVTKRGRPRKVLTFEEALSTNVPQIPKRGRPRKVLSTSESSVNK